MPVHPDFPYRLYLVISEENCIHLPWLSLAEEAIKGGVDIIQLREKTAGKDEFMAKASALKSLTDSYGIPLVINDRVDIAVEVDAWGIHVGQTDTAPSHIMDKYGDRFHIGWSIEQIEQLNSPEMKAVHHLGLSPIYSTDTKRNTLTEWGMEGISDIRSQTDKPLIAIGNMNRTNAKQALLAGADSVAVVSAICAEPNPKEASQILKLLLQ